MLRVMPYLFLGFAAPALAQGIVGEGNQSQSIELLQSGVSVGIDSSGSLSLGRGEPSAGIGAGLSINDTSIIGVDTGDHRERGPVLSPDQGAANNGALVRSSGTEGTSIANFVQAPTGNAEECPTQNASVADLDRSLQPGQQIWLRPMDCSVTVDGTADLLASYPQFSRAVSDAGETLDNAIAITVSDDLVIIVIEPSR